MNWKKAGVSLMVHHKYIEFQTSLSRALNFNLENIDSLPVLRPSIDWEISIDKELKFTKHAKGSEIQLTVGKNDSIVSLFFQHHSLVELVLIRAYCRYYMKRAEDLPLIRKKSFNVK
jgi:hypothetical protein